MVLTLTSMDYFVMLARERSFTRAAEKLHITQQTLSAHIAALERELDCQLLVRKVPLELTYGGKVFLRYAAEFQQKVSSLREEFCDITANQRGVLRVGVAYTRGRTIMPALIEAFQTRYPNICIELAEDSNNALHKNVLNGEIDLAIANFSNPLQGVHLEEFYKEEVVLLASRALLERLYGETLPEVQRRVEGGDLSPLQSCPFLLGSEADIATQIAHTFLRRADLRPAVRARSENVETLLELCRRGLGACFSPENLARATLTPAQMEGLTLFHLGEDAKLQIRFGYLPHTYQWSILSEFIQIARETLL